MGVSRTMSAMSESQRYGPLGATTAFASAAGRRAKLGDAPT